ncbi:hypothetical protein ACFP47_11300 [Nesterenkonia lacusekhoensis]|uniref:Uncharacterized protein n=1 Tax=Nesterenkonia lacusekhoensis TaxID=150832 RepID=A0ABS4T5U5_9MICC|nr:hypothetical protein [Nesterenkonia lacusekhoensis]MBP2319535.1 hypothetical protein [Nesterenkonia lacusekhoensis]
MKFAADKARRPALATLAAAAILGATGCSAVNYQATTNQYDPSNGVGVEIEDVKYADIILLTTEEGESARAIGSIINTDYGSEATAADVEISVDGESFSTTLEPGERVSLEHDEEFIVDGFDGDIGGFHDVEYTVDGETETVPTTVLDGTLKEYREALLQDFDSEDIAHLEDCTATHGGGAADDPHDEEGLELCNDLYMEIYEQQQAESDDEGGH